MRGGDEEVEEEEEEEEGDSGKIRQTSSVSLQTGRPPKQQHDTAEGALRSCKTTIAHHGEVPNLC